MTDSATALVPAEPALPEAVARRGATEAQWRTLCGSLYPGANPQSVLLVLDYCKARNLDPMKKACHIVAMEVKDAKTAVYSWRDVIMPGIYEYRTTAHRTGEYLGHDPVVYGPDQQYKNLTVPEWVELTVYRWNQLAKIKAPFTVRTYFREVVALSKDKQTQQWGPNARWSKAPIQMVCKCNEAAALREAFPDVLGGTLTEEEMDGQRAITIDVTKEQEPPPVLAIFKSLDEELQRQIDTQFSALHMTDAQRLMKLNEYFGGPDVKLGDAASKLLSWCGEQAAKDANRMVKPKADANRKTKPEPPKDAEALEFQ